MFKQQKHAEVLPAGVSMATSDMFRHVDSQICLNGGEQQLRCAIMHLCQ